MTDSIKGQFNEQLMFLLDIHENFDSLSTKERIEWTRQYVLHGTSEFMEVLNTMPWKSWLTTNETGPNLDALLEESVDVWKFVMNILLLWGATPEQFSEAFARKHEVNIQRFLQYKLLRRLQTEHRRAVGKHRVAAIDLDGVLVNYPEDWLAFIEARTGVEIPLETFSLAYGSDKLPREIYAKLKDEYRNGGWERQTLARPGARAFMEALKAKDFKLVILSARPVDRYKRLYADSIAWLRDNEIPFDVVIWDQHKEDRVIKDLPFIEFVLEDDADNAMKLHRAQIQVYLLERPYNNHIVMLSGPPHLADFDSILKTLDLRDREAHTS